MRGAAAARHLDAGYSWSFDAKAGIMHLANRSHAVCK
jgi:hypothetical protein